MARGFAPGAISGLAGQVETHVDGKTIDPGDELPEGTETFDITYWHWPTPADLLAGSPRGQRIKVALFEIPLDWTDADIRNELLALRARAREEKAFGSDGIAGVVIR